MLTPGPLSPAHLGAKSTEQNKKAPISQGSPSPFHPIIFRSCEECLFL